MNTAEQYGITPEMLRDAAEEAGVTLYTGRQDDCAEAFAAALNKRAGVPQMTKALKTVHGYFVAIDEMNPRRNRGTEGRRVRALVRNLVCSAGVSNEN